MSGSPPATDRYDYIIVGAGTTGCVLANRLSADPSLRVLVLEAGGADRDPRVRMPLSWHKASQSRRFTWGYESDPVPATNARAMDLPRGRLLGGTSSINGMMYSRGNRGDYDGWAALGLDGWGYDDVLPYFRRAECSWRGDTPFHGGDGPMMASRNPVAPVIYPAMIQTAERLGYRHLDDFHGPTQEGFGMADFNVRRGRRESAATAYLAPARRRPNLTLRMGALTTRVRLADRRAVGVEYELDGQARAADGREVIICGGAYNSPHVLLLSGIGPAEELRALGIAPQHDLPAVGRNLQDHPLIPAVYEAARPLGFDRLLRLDRLAVATIRWALSGNGPVGEAPLSVQGFIRTEPGTDRPDTQFQVSHVSFAARPWFPGWRAGEGHRFTAAACQMRPHGRGSVTLASADPRVLPRVSLGLLEHPADLQAARDMLSFIRRFFTTAPVSDLVATEMMPGARADTPSGMDDYLREMMMTAMHPAGSCAMGTDPRVSVVDAALCVHGIQGLRVADTSIMPRIVSGNTGAPAVMIGEKAADLILHRMPPAPRAHDAH